MRRVGGRFGFFFLILYFGVTAVTRVRLVM
jgi:hypothetical protein